MRLWFVVVGMALAISVDSAHADYVLTPLSSPGGLSQVSVSPGGSFTVSLVLTSDASDTCTSAIFTLDFSKSGLRLDNYSWGGGFNGSAFDASDPATADAPLVIGADTYIPTVDDGKIDLYYDNFTTTPFSAGTLVTLNFTVPVGFAPGQVTMTTVPDQFSAGAGLIPTTGDTFTVTVVPEPTSMALLAVGSVMLVRRRRQMRP